jgi:hypothetical protein
MTQSPNLRLDGKTAKTFATAGAMVKILHLNGERARQPLS